MSIPTLKRIRITSVQQLETWLSNNSDHPSDIMIVTFTDPTHPDFVSVDQLKNGLVSYGWSQGRRYTLGKNQLGHVIRKQN